VDKLNKSEIIRSYLSKLKQVDRTTIVLSLLVGIGLIIHAVYPLIHQPMYNMQGSDPARHYQYALGPLKECGSYLELLGYQIWLYVSLNIVGRTPLNSAIYSAALSVITPLLWFRWFKECLPTKQSALFALALLVFLPTWITIYGFFMSETLLLPLLGLSLWLTWRAKRIQSLPAILLAILAWFLALCTKFSIIPEMILTLSWLFWNIAQERRMGRLWITLPIAIIAMTTALIIPAIINYCYIGTAWLFPPGGIYSYANACYCLSGAKSFSIDINSPSKHFQAHGDYASNVAVCPQDVLNFLGWPYTRSGNYAVVIDGRTPPSIMAPKLPPHFVLDARLVAENTLSFFFSHSWPDCQSSDFMQLIQRQSRLIWFPITALTLILMLRQRNYNVVVILSLFTAVCFCLQSFVVMEGRYRKPWEGIAIAALVSLLSSARLKHRRPGATCNYCCLLRKHKNIHRRAGR
jgi:hypothetical protein